jgi:hypothetical protein
MSADSTFPSLGPIEAARSALDLVENALSGRPVRIDAEDPVLVALIAALAELASLFVQLAAHQVQATPDTARYVPSELLGVVRAHQELQHDLDRFDDGERP